MKYSVIVPILKGVFIKRVDRFLKSLSKTDRAFHLIIINNLRESIEPLVESYGFSNFSVINNVSPCSYFVSLSQGISLSVRHNEYSVCVNPERSLLLKNDWLDYFSKYDSLFFGGHIYEYKINFSHDINNIISLACDRDHDLSWLELNMSDDFKIKCIDKNIFIVKNEIVNKLGYFKNIESSSFDDYPMIEFCLRFLYKDYPLLEVKEIFSKNSIIGNVSDDIDENVGIVYPISRLL